ncbi:hypothetical protein OH76DRAFT_1488568 [Lentinus brumalis]|uniref:Uncharacterized protein n=1 Tax=Lentinus brumalis TaxID=2498619 RepID=A0A371CQF5_9APHY|nr:hypothetical protein OH76DRAFT_1488568 [Polyporus brumalis]
MDLTPSQEPEMELRVQQFRRYFTRPQHDPEEGLTLDDFTDTRTHILRSGQRDDQRSEPSIQYAGYHVQGKGSSVFDAEDGWRKARVTISLPKEGVSHANEQAAPQLDIDNIHYCPFLKVIKAAYQDSIANKFHWFPHRLLRQPGALEPSTSSSPSDASASSAPAPEQLRSDIYNSDAMLKEDQNREEDDPPDIEYAIAPILIYSNSTHLTNFGTAALWPIYVFFGSLSKYICACPSAFATHHLAYIPSLLLSIQTIYKHVYGEPASAAVLRFCKHQLMQAIWMLLLDDDFLKALSMGSS